MSTSSDLTTAADPVDQPAPAERQPRALNGWIGAGIGAGIGSAAIAAALLYASRARKKGATK